MRVKIVQTRKKCVHALYRTLVSLRTKPKEKPPSYHLITKTAFTMIISAQSSSLFNGRIDVVLMASMYANPTIQYWMGS